MGIRKIALQIIPENSDLPVAESTATGSGNLSASFIDATLGTAQEVMNSPVTLQNISFN
jgi:hypothetical protein